MGFPENWERIGRIKKYKKQEMIYNICRQPEKAGIADDSEA